MKIQNSYTWNVLFGIGLSSLVLQGCSSHTETTNKENTQQSQTLTIGFQKSSLSSIVLQTEQNLLKKEFPQVNVQWREFPAGPQMLEALSAGAIDIGSVGNTPPIFAQAGNKNIVYVGYENVQPQWQAAVVSANSTIQNIEQLKGKKVAVQKGSSAHDLLGRVLEKAHLKWSDIQPVWLAPADARAALDKGSVDAWVIWEPFLTVAEVEGNARPIIDGTQFENTYNFLISRPDFVKNHASEVKSFIQASNEAAQWIVAHPTETRSLYQNAINVNADIAQRVLDKRYKPSLMKPMTNEVIAAQQQIADRFTTDQVIPQHIDVKQAVWQGQ